MRALVVALLIALTVSTSWGFGEMIRHGSPLKSGTASPAHLTDVLLNTSAPTLYFTVTVAEFLATVTIYSDSGRTVTVANGNSSGGAVTLSQVGGSGVYGTATLNVTLASDGTYNGSIAF